jgi:energy-converting hydrogenase A subunit L
MNETSYLLYLISFVLGSVVGLVLSYQKYKSPFAIDKIDVLALVIAIIGWFLTLNSSLLTFIPSYVAIAMGLFLVALVLGMRPGYGRYETIIGLAVGGIIWLLRTVAL